MKFSLCIASATVPTPSDSPVVYGRRDGDSGGGGGDGGTSCSACHTWIPGDLKGGDPFGSVLR
jgi:hypothetical protein